MKTRSLILLLSIAACSPLSALAADAAPPTASTPKAAPANPVYGSQLMTPGERRAYRMKMRSAKNPEERTQIRAEHHAAMQARAKERGVTLPDVPPAGGAGMGPGGGMGRGAGTGPGAGMGPGTGPGMGPGMGRPAQ